MYAARQAVGLVNDVRPAGDIVRQLADEAAEALRDGGRLFPVTAAYSLTWSAQRCAGSYPRSRLA